MRWGRAVGAVAVIATTLVLDATAAHACSCGYEGVRARLHGSSTVAVVRALDVTTEEIHGAPIDAAELDVPQIDGVSSPGVVRPFRIQRTATLEVVRPIKGSLPDTFTIPVEDESACGISAHEGEVFAASFGETDGQWSTSLCEMIDVEELDRALEPRPAPNGRGPPAFYVAGEFARSFGLVLDQQGRTIRYDDAGTVVGTCGQHEAVIVRKTGDTELSVGAELDNEKNVDPGVDRHMLPVEAIWSVEGVWCTSAAEVVVAANTDQATTHFFRIKRGQVSIIAVIHNTLWSSLAFGAERAYLLADDSPYDETGTSHLVVVDLDDGTQRRLTDFSAGAGRLDLSPDGSTIAVAVGGREETPAEVWTVDAGNGKVLRRATLPGSRYDVIPRWVGNSTLVAVPTTSDRPTVRVYNRRLALLDTWDGWWSDDVVVRDGTLYGTSAQSVKVAPALTGPSHRFAHLRRDRRTPLGCVSGWFSGGFYPLKAPGRLVCRGSRRSRFRRPRRHRPPLSAPSRMRDDPPPEVRQMKLLRRNRRSPPESAGSVVIASVGAAS